MEITQALVEQIVERVIQLLKMADGPADRPGQRITAVFSAGMSGGEEACRGLRDLTERGCSVQALFTPCAETVNGPAWLLERVPAARICGESACSPRAWVEETDLVVIPVLTVNSAAKLAHGMADNRALSVVMAALMAGKPVVAATDACTGRPGTPVAERVLDRNLHLLRQCGVELVPAADLAVSVRNRLGPGGQTECPAPHPLPRFAGRVLSIRDLRQIRAEKLYVSSGTIVTPAAMDEARNRKIQIIQDNP